MTSSNTDVQTRVRRLRQIMTMILCLLGLTFALTAQAQTSAGAQTPATSSASSTTDTTPPASYTALADLLENPDTREHLVEQLRSLAATAGSADTAVVEKNPEPPRLAALTTQSASIAARMQNFSNQLTADLADSWRVVTGLLSGKAVHGVSIKHWLPALYSLLIAIVAVSVAYLLLRMVASAGFRRVDAWVIKQDHIQDEQHPTRHSKQTGHSGHKKIQFALLRMRGRKLLGVLAALAIDLAASLLAALAGYAAVIAIIRHGASPYLFAMQFLTAFVMVEIAKALIRAVFATRYERLRLLPVSHEVAQYWNRWLITIISITGYSLLVVVPVVQAIMTRAVGNLLGLLVMLVVYLYAVNVVWSKRKTVRSGLTQIAEGVSTSFFATLILILARTWHWLSLTYLTVLFIVSQTQQQQALSFMGKATAQSLLAILIGGIVITAISALAHRHIRLPDNWRQALPSLEPRLNAYIPAFLQGLRLLVLILITLIVLDAWNTFDLTHWLSSDMGQAATSTVIRVGIILFIAAMSWTVLASIIEHRLSPAQGYRLPTEREKTLLMLFRNAAAITIATMTTLVVLSQIGIDIGPLIAGAGVAGLAIGFGAQKLVQDVITGVFIQLENGMNQNDVVQVAGLFGTVEKITIRSVVIRTIDGGYHLIPFSSIDTLSNHTRDYGYHLGEYTIAHRESIQDATAQLELAFKALMQDPALAAEVLEEITIPGVTALNDKGFTIRVLIKTNAGSQWMVQRAYNRLVKEHFDAAGIELPYPQTVLHFGRDKDGHAAPLDIRDVSKLEDTFNMKSAPGQTRRPLDRDPDMNTPETAPG